MLDIIFHVRIVSCIMREREGKYCIIIFFEEIIALYSSGFLYFPRKLGSSQLASGYFTFSYHTKKMRIRNIEI